MKLDLIDSVRMFDSASKSHEVTMGAMACSFRYGVYVFVVTVGCIFFGWIGRGTTWAETPNLGPFLVQVVNPLSGIKILPHTDPLPGERSTTIMMQACPGEYEPASFVIRPLTADVQDVMPVAGDLVSDRSVIAGNNVDIKLVKVWYQAGGAGETHRIKRGVTPVMIPELLINDDDLVVVDTRTKKNFLRASINGHSQLVDISQAEAQKGQVVKPVSEFDVRDGSSLQPIKLIERNKAQQYWITVRVPDNALPGEYAGSIQIKSGGRNIGTMILNLKVLPFNLKDPTLTYSLYYHAHLVSGVGTISSKFKSEAQLRAELQDMFNHGVKNPTVYQDPGNKELLAKVLTIRRQVGMGGQPLFYLGIKTEDVNNQHAKARYVEAAKRLMAVANENGVSGLYVYGIDEAEEGLLEKQKTIWGALRQEGVKIFVAGWRPGHWNLVKESLDVYVDGQPPDRTVADSFRGHGNKVFAYNTPQVGIENPLVYRRNYGLRLWQAGYDGAMDYAYQHGFGFVWNDFDHDEFRDHNFTYPTSTGVISTIAWEGFREGVDDVRYINVLEALINKESLSGDQKKRETANDAARFLSVLKDYTGDLDSMRRQLVQYSVQLQ